MRVLLITLAIASSAVGIRAPDRRPSAGRAAVRPAAKDDLVAAKAVEAKPPGVLGLAYKACGLAMTGAWTTCVLTTIRSNQPVGMMMPSVQHGLFARIGAMSAAPVILSCFATLASKQSWEEFAEPRMRRLNLALVTAGLTSALWVAYAPLLTKIPGTNPLVSHQSYSGATRAALIASYGSAAALSAAVWARSLPEDVRKNPLSWPGRVADGVAKSLVSLAPANSDNPVNVKYTVLTTSFLLFTALQLGSHPLSVIPSWTGRRLARAFPAWTLLAAVSSYNLKEAVESGKIFADSTSRALSNGLKGFGATYMTAKIGAVFLDPSFPASYHAVIMVPGWAAAATVLIATTLRSDNVD
jgi:hypothetical protein